MKDTILFGKYHLLHQLGTGRVRTVWLAMHIGLEEYRTIKYISKRDADHDSFRREALVLKELHHPGIPVIYDSEEDSEFFYLIEEYPEGYSLYVLIANQGPIQKAEAIRYGIQICGLVAYMHSAYETPILHSDLQSDNPIICNDTVKLVDFDHATGCRWAGIAPRRFGTVGCAAPEQYASNYMLGQRIDIYAIDVVLRFVAAGTLREDAGQSTAPSEDFEWIIRKCIDSDMERRYVPTSEVENAPQALCTGELTEEKEQKTVPSHILILIGMKTRTGTTHSALGLVHFLNRSGYQAFCEGHNVSRAVVAIVQRAGIRPDRFGIYTMNGYCLKPWYGPAVKLDEGTGFNVIVRDYGTDWQQAELELKAAKADLIRTGSASVWGGRYIRRYISWVNQAWTGRCSGNRVLVFRNTRAVCQRGLKVMAESDRALKGIKLFVLPECENPFSQKGGDAFFQSLWSAIIGGGRWKKRRGSLKRRGFLRESSLETAGNLQESAGLSESQGQDGEQG